MITIGHVVSKKKEVKKSKIVNGRQTTHDDKGQLQ